MVKICIIHYNTPKLTECLVRSINKFTPDCHIYIFDNSDKQPFINTFKNVTIFDNTKGQIINFDKWLAKYPRRNISPGKLNKWGSAKHCYSVEKCMSLINDNFILMDSDILLKKDISNIVDDSKIFVGTVVTQPKSTIQRVIPFISYINVKKCLLHNVHYFDDNYMHGLRKTIKSDYYDTGAGFFIHAKPYDYKTIKWEDYAIHYKGGSWAAGKEKIYGTKMKPEEWLNMNSELWGGQNFEKYKSALVNGMKNLYHIPLNLNNPQTIQDKINWMKIYDSTPLKTKCADKIKVHDYCKEKLGKDICIPIIKTYNSTKEINWNELPNQFVIKCNHGSGMNIIVRDKSKLDKTDCISKLNKWMLKDFAFANFYEMHYHNIPRKILVEEYKSDKNQQSSLLDYKVWCFNGTPKFIQTIHDRTSQKYSNFYDLNWNYIEMYRADLKSNPSKICEKPANFDKMIEYATILSKDFKFVRVDFYEINNTLYLGELTFTPGSGIFKFTKPEQAKKIGSMLSLENQTNEIASNKDNKKVIYTCITSGYDSLRTNTKYCEGFDYVCFTDDMNIEHGQWILKPIPEELKDLTPVKRQRLIKINPHKYLSEYDLSIWVDGSISIVGDINRYLDTILDENISIYIPQHPMRNCIYKEGDTCIKMKKDTAEHINKQLKRYSSEGFPKEYGLVQSNIIVRKHNYEDCKKVMETWSNELINESHRDQLSFNYALWKNQDVKIKLLDKKICNSPYFNWDRFHKKIKPTPVNAEKTISATTEIKPESQSSPSIIDSIKVSRTVPQKAQIVKKPIKKNNIRTNSLRILMS